MLFRKLKHFRHVRILDKKIETREDLEKILDGFDRLTFNSGIAVKSKDQSLNQASVADVFAFLTNVVPSNERSYVSGTYQVYTNGHLEYHYVDIKSGRKSSYIGSNRVRYPPDNQINISCIISK